MFKHIFIILQEASCACAIVISVFILIRAKASLGKWIIPLYCIASLVTDYFSYYSHNNILSNKAINIFTISEFFFFSIFAAINTKLKSSFIYLLLSSSFFLFLILKAFKKTNYTFAFSSGVTILIENFFLPPILLMYFYSLFKRSAIINYKSNYVFWIMAGMLTYIALSTPYFILVAAMRKEAQANFFSLVSISYIFMMCLYIKANLCLVKPQ